MRNEQPRAVVLVGPPKTGSTHVQSFLAANQDQLLKFGWQWPRAVDGGRAGPKSFANLVGALANSSCREEIWTDAPTVVDAVMKLCHGTKGEKDAYQRQHTRVLDAFRREFQRIASAGLNLILSAEDLAYLDGDDAGAQHARNLLRHDLLAPFGSRVTVAITYRTPRASALQSVYAEDVEWAANGVRAASDALAPLSAWFAARLHSGALLRSPPWSGSMNPGRLASAFETSGFRIAVISSAGVQRDGVDVTDAVACELLSTPCVRGKAHWSTYKRARTAEMHYDGVAHDMEALVPRLMHAAGCDPPPRTDSYSPPSEKESKELESVHGAVVRCSDLRALDELLAALDVPFVARFGGRMLHWDAHAEATERNAGRTYCELDLSVDATWAALRRSAEARGYNCGDGRDFNDWARAAARAARQRRGGRQAHTQETHSEEEAPASTSSGDVKLTAPGRQSLRGRHGVLAALRRGCKPTTVCSLQLQPPAAAAAVQRERAAWSSCALAHDDDREDDAPPRVAYVLLASPFKRDAGRGQGIVHGEDVLRMHLMALRRTASAVAHLLIMLPSESARGIAWESRVAGDYLDVMEEAMLLPFPADLVRLPNNTLGSYGMGLSAYSMHRDAFDLYVFAEDDYVPVRPRFDEALVRMHAAAFGQKPGVLAGLLQGRPVEPTSQWLLHCESAHVMSSVTLRHLFDHVYGGGFGGHVIEHALSVLAAEGVCRPERREGCHQLDLPSWENSPFDRIQLAFGALLRDASIEARDWTAAYRAPYYDHVNVVDWSGAAQNFTVHPERALIAPLQWVFTRHIKVCCATFDCTYLKDQRGDQPGSCSLPRNPSPQRLSHFECCPSSVKHLLVHRYLAPHWDASLPRSQADVRDAQQERLRDRVGECAPLQPEALVVEGRTIQPK